tara:strand:+ start:1352 stop:1576 length:225 start_codon:yes stop_codon:yes gene_type:complete
MGDAEFGNGMGSLPNQRKLMVEQMGRDSNAKPQYEQFRGRRRYEVSERIKQGARVERGDNRFEAERNERRKSLK